MVTADFDVEEMVAKFLFMHTTGMVNIAGQCHKGGWASASPMESAGFLASYQKEEPADGWNTQ